MNDRKIVFLNIQVVEEAVSKIGSHIVQLLGGNKYTNTLYGKDAKGQFITFNNKNNSSNNNNNNNHNNSNNSGGYSIVSENKMNDEMGKPGFIPAKSYDRKDLLKNGKKVNFLHHTEFTVLRNLLEPS